MRVFQRILRLLFHHPNKKIPTFCERSGFGRRVRLVGFDDAVTAPLYGLGSAAEYYAWASSGPRLGAIRTQTLLISAKDDPLAPASHLPAVENGKLKRIVADLSLDKAMLQDVISRKL